MKTSNLTHITVASSAAQCITRQPAVPVVVHWQMQDFPLRMARTFKETHNVVWVVSTTERADIVERELTNAGIAVNRVRADVPDPMPDSLTRMERYRLVKKRKDERRPTRYPQPEKGVVTLVRLKRISHEVPLSDFRGWMSPLVVFDHIGSVNAKWLELDASGDGTERKFTDRLTVKAHHAKLIPALHKMQMPMLFLARDEYEIALLKADFARRAAVTSDLSTKYVLPKKLAASVISTDLVTAKYASAAFLSIRACNPQAQMVGDALIGATTPSILSMSTAAQLKKAVVKVAHLHKEHVDIAHMQTQLSRIELRAIRLRDIVRTAVLAIDPASRTPELVFFCAEDMAAEVANQLQAKVTRLPRWRYGNYDAGSVIDRPFARDVIKAAATYPNALDREGRMDAIKKAMAVEGKSMPPRKMARLALAIHSGSALGEELNLAARAEEFSGASERADKAIGLFNKILDAAYPWSPHAPGENLKNLKARREVFGLYRAYRKAREEKQ